MLIYKFELREISHPSSTVPSLNTRSFFKKCTSSYAKESGRIAKSSNYTDMTECGHTSGKAKCKVSG
jgi:hypothetical protein